MFCTDTTSAELSVQDVSHCPNKHARWDSTGTAVDLQSVQVWHHVAGTVPVQLSICNQSSFGITFASLCTPSMQTAFLFVCMCVCVCVCVCARARACVRACVRVCVSTRGGGGGRGGREGGREGAIIVYYRYFWQSFTFQRWNKVIRCMCLVSFCCLLPC